MGAFKGGGICPLYPQLRKESWSPLSFVSKMTGLWMLHVNVTEILLHKNITKA